MIPNNYLTGSKIPELIINQQGFSSRHNLPLSLGDSSLAAWGVSVAALPLRRIPWKLWKKCLQWKWWEYHAIVGRISKISTVWKIRFPMRIYENNTIFLEVSSIVRQPRRSCVGLSWPHQQDLLDLLDLLIASDDSRRAKPEMFTNSDWTLMANPSYLRYLNKITCTWKHQEATQAGWVLDLAGVWRFCAGVTNTKQRLTWIYHGMRCRCQNANLEKSTFIILAK